MDGRSTDASQMSPNQQDRGSVQRTFNPGRLDTAGALRLSIEVNPRRIVVIMTVAAVVLVVLSLVGQFSKLFWGHDYLMGFVPLFDLGGEGNAPSWFSSACMLFCSVLLGVISQSSKRQGEEYWKHWRFLALVFLVLSIDEAAMMHELTAAPLRVMFNTGGFLFWPWVVPAFIFCLALFLSYLKFLFSLDSRTRWGFVLAGAVFAAGALGVELFEAKQASIYGEIHLHRVPQFVMLVTVEETMEMAGMIIFAYALLRYIARRQGRTKSLVGNGAS